MMETPEIIDGLKDLIKDRNSFIDQNEPDNVFEHDKEVLKAAIDALSVASENKPLTLDELRKMGSNPIWISEKVNEGQDARSLWQQFAYEEPKTGIIALWEFGYEVENEYKISEYGKTWVAYARKPEGRKADGRT